MPRIEEEHIQWFRQNHDSARAIDFGFRLKGGGAHQSKTMMLVELNSILESRRLLSSELRRAAIEDNILNKSTVNSRRLTFGHLNSLYGLTEQSALTRVLFSLWQFDPASRPLSALLTSLSRDPMLRSTAEVALSAAVGERTERASFESALLDAHPDRFSEKMIRSMAQNCAASWTQSGHLTGRAKKYRSRVIPTPAAAAFAALIATVAGFGGPSLLDSVWMRVLDLSPEQALDQLRRAEAMGLAKVRSAGDVTEISIRQSMASTLGVQELEHV